MKSDVERLRELRKHFKLSQTEFAEKLGVTRSVIKNLELGVVEIKDHMFKLISATFGASEEWLRNGTGEMFVQTSKTILDDLKTQYNLDSMDIAIFEGYLSLAEHERETVKKYILGIAERAKSERSYTREDMIAGRIAAADKKIAEEIGAKKQ